MSQQSMTGLMAMLMILPTSQRQPPGKPGNATPAARPSELSNTVLNAVFITEPNAVRTADWWADKASEA